VHVSVRVGVGGREINEFGVMLYVNTLEQNKTEEEKERKEEGSRPVVCNYCCCCPLSAIEAAKRKKNKA